MSYRKKYIRPKIKKLKPKKSVFKKPSFWLIVLAIVVISLVCFIAFFPNFQVEHIQLSGNERVATADIENALWPSIKTKLSAGILSVSSKSIFMVNTIELQKNLLQKFAQIESVTLQKKFPQTLTLTINERKAVAVFCQPTQTPNEACFSIDGDGIIFEALSAIPQGLVVVRNAAQGRINALGEQSVPKNIIDLILKTQTDVKNNFQIDIKEATIADTVVLKTSENWLIYLDPNSDVNLQIVKLNTLLKDQIPANTRKNIQYIYLQYKDRAYYK